MTTQTNGAGAPTTAHQALGAYGERVAAAHLTEAGMHLLDRNWRCPEGEIDLVLRDGDDLVVCEVKTRAGATGGTPHEAVTSEKLGRLVRLGEAWQEARGVRAPALRVDLVAVRRPRRGPALVEHVRGLV
ncbi:YraN family protein [Nocardioides bruguierae]|uniref:UPF0102 protein M8330_04960 n=1 Tax=Nocardioides bruguierae TaxID=2945102 RepID=A0A9X2IE32_9ACTN|nr:YraN family protein [Nocardioides bruguierae]MCL8026624.1 YraN family protein [Nocardioides bruguierae]MCM0619643.1 YraN family protein [Nocardioides bruguierae]